jgi:hypothetical protein
MNFMIADGRGKDGHGVNSAMASKERVKQWEKRVLPKHGDIKNFETRPALLHPNEDPSGTVQASSL